MSELKIKAPKTPEEFRAIETIQKSAWGMSDIEIVPYRIIIAISKAGGCVYIAYDNNKPVGFVLGFIALDPKTGQVYMHSHQVGVVREYWNKGIAYRLKVKQREDALARNIALIRWTFDPLLSRNAYLNFSKLGVVNNTYFINLYGEMRDMINRGLPSDRFYVEWWIKSNHVKKRLSGERPPLDITFLLNNLSIVNITRKKNNLREIVDYDLSMKDKILLVEIPYDITLIKKRDMMLAFAWRNATREIFTALFSKGYIATDFMVGEIDSEKRSFYILIRDEKQKLLREPWWSFLA